jgi:hypothetical protein
LAQLTLNFSGAETFWQWRADESAVFADFKSFASEAENGIFWQKVAGSCWSEPPERMSGKIRTNF